jgi:uncharacterized protein YbjT (DUF2867 family)
MGDLRDSASLRRACAGIDTVVSTANAAARGGADTTDSVDRAGNRSLIDATRATGVDHFIFVSALGASAESPVDFLRAKAETERHLQGSGMTWTILQPNIFMEVWIGMLVGVPLSQGQPVTLVGRGDHRHALVSLRDVGAFAVGAVTNPEARDALLVIGGPEALTWTDVVEQAGAVVGRPLEVRYVEPGQPLPGLPPIAADLAAAFETYETVIDTSELAATFEVRLTSVKEFLSDMLGAVAAGS